MTNQTKQPVRIRGLAAWLAAASVLVLLGVNGVRAGGATEGGRGIPAAAAPAGTSPAKQGKQRPAEERAGVHALAGKRDPFKVPPPPRVGGGNGVMDAPLPPGARGLVIGQLRLKGIVREDANNTMIAVVMNSTNLAYFLRVHEEVYNGVVTKITPGAVYFLEKNAGTGGPGAAREVVLRLGSARQEAR